MPKVTKRDQLREVQKLLAEAAYKLSAEGDNWEQGYLALQNARAIIADLNGDLESARAARKFAEHMEKLKSAQVVSIEHIQNGVNHAGTYQR